MSSINTRLAAIEQRLRPSIKVLPLERLYELTDADKQLMREQGIEIPIPLKDLRKVASDE